MADKKYIQNHNKEQNFNPKTWPDSNQLDDKSAIANDNDK